MNRRILVSGIGAAAVLAAAGALIATAETEGPVFIAGDKPVTEDQVRQKLLTDGYLDVKVVRQGRYFEASGAKNGKTAKRQKCWSIRRPAGWPTTTMTTTKRLQTGA